MRKVLSLAMVSAFAATGCVDIVGAGAAKYVDRTEKHFTTSASPDLLLSTFDGSIEIHSWDKPEVQVIVEKRAVTREAAESIEVRAEQNGNQVTVDATVPKSSAFGVHFNSSRSAKLIVSAPAGANISAKSGDGSIDVERIGGRLELRSGDGSIRGRELGGEVRAHTGDGSIRLDGVSGALDVDTGDGSVNVSGKLTALRARSGDGSMVIHADAGTSPSGDWDITTGDGSITLDVPDGFNGELDAHTGDGSVHLNAVELSNVTGEIGRRTVKGRLGSGGRTVRLRTGDGSITIRR